ncbi:MAG: calcium/proton exchanger [Planctomycetaceae bacterium]|nr:calcium/proton exchanger [Planctomycetota bacterium]NUN52120.1 calcium/proton exchanger [Planctomycetaceae bacterium]
MGFLKRILAGPDLLNLLLVFVPVAAFLEFSHAGPVLVFTASCLAIIPLAGWMGRATEHIAERTGQGIGGLLNATFGNMAELIIAVMALREGHHEVVKASITGSILGNVLLVFGLAALAGGIRRPSQSFNRTAAGMSATLLALSAVALVVPTLFHSIVGPDHATSERGLSFDISLVLLVTYVLSLVFVLKTHSHLYAGGEGHGATPAPPGEAHAEGGGHGPPWPVGKAVGVLVAATAGVAVMAEFLVGAIDGVAREAGMNPVFIGVVLVAIVGNAAEHSTAVIVAMKDKMDLAFNIAVGSSIQVALFVAPVLLLLSYVVGPSPMDLLFSPLEVLSVAACVGIAALVAQDGESNWLEGVMMLAVYAILAMAFWFLPVAAR